LSRKVRDKVKDEVRSSKNLKSGREDLLRYLYIGEVKSRNVPSSKYLKP